ncbi:hypothetical protein PF001_g6646 [Phytophthora fragariae]|uniref:Uncharacterized protein n=1 Tax=Phytophthora fragariae TaxID=53985 RepID=A0A6A4E6T9_9STRA|nr:hypothetical protein PF003_g18215 [Phytophthora fragariae]KAE8942066.1 hypothetical protein PF009_g8158 [Phytophthora fragariae]KAE9149146.1 hypothetical protein PF006_g6338 [Phytophthora fragariae]KAE9317862.1 hypothetical protein PF001_g6646 [Phytophthora fragariae]KAE9344858.1 hypothetical protein PF008_g9033 [Phytophthora fragariae]
MHQKSLVQKRELFPKKFSRNPGRMPEAGIMNHDGQADLIKPGELRGSALLHVSLQYDRLPFTLPQKDQHRVVSSRCALLKIQDLWIRSPVSGRGTIAGIAGPIAAVFAGSA